jgi:methionyl-tRNA formyltransferase
VRVVFMGSPPFAVPVLSALFASRHEIAAVATRPDRPRGRGRSVEPSPLVELARVHAARVLQPGSARDPAFVTELRTLAPDVVLVASYGEILKRDVLELAPHGALNVHASLLPRHRGASPIQAAILAGDAETGVTIQRMVAKLVEGDVLLALSTPIGAHENAGDLLERLARLGGEAAVRALDAIEAGSARFTPQDPGRATYAKKIEKHDGVVDWTKDAASVVRLVRAMTPWPGAHTQDASGRELVLLDVRATSANELAAVSPDRANEASATLAANANEDAAMSPGTLVVVEGAPFVVTGRGLVEIRALKPAGKARVDGAAWLRGARLQTGARLGACARVGVGESGRRRMLRWVPIATPVRNCSCQVCWPIDISATSAPPCFSLIRNASSMAISSKGLITHFTLSVAIPEPSGRIRMVVAGSGTRFTETRIFTAVSLRVYSAEHS